MAQRVYAWIDAMNERGVSLDIIAPAGARSPTVTCIRLPSGWTGPKVVAAARERGFAVATGYGKLKDGTFRIGHMGDHTLDELEALLEALTDVFA
jgi:aspartate aminotransferase-like enzyme